MNVLIFGGDARQLEVSRILKERGDHVFLVGFEQANVQLNGVKTILLEELPYSSIDLFVLPVSGVKKGGVVEAPFSAKPLVLTREMAGRLPAGCLVISGIDTPALKELVSREILFIFDREDVAILNSIPTAEGTLMLAMQKTTRTIHGSRVLVIGLGRIGITIARLFQQVGAFVSTAVRETGKFARATEMQVNPIYMENVQKEIGNFDIIINTVPSLVITQALIKQIKPSALILDLASYPGGTDFAAAAEAGIQTIHALGLPGKVAPETAGEILGRVLIDAVHEWKMERGL